MGFAAIYQDKKNWEFDKSLFVQTVKASVPELHNIHECLLASLEEMSKFDCIGKLFPDAIKDKLTTHSFDLNYLIFRVIMKDFQLNNLEQLFVVPYVAAIKDNLKDSRKSKRSKAAENDDNEVDSEVHVGTMMGLTRKERNARDLLSSMTQIPEQHKVDTTPTTRVHGVSGSAKVTTIRSQSSAKGIIKRGMIQKTIITY